MRSRRRSSASRDEEFTELSRAGNNSPRGLWSDGVNMWVLDGGKEALFAYDLASGARLASLSLSGVAASARQARRAPGGCGRHVELGDLARR